MIRPILRYGADVLHQPARPVAEITADILQLIDDMIQTMYAAPGVGLAATQVGVPLRIFVADVSLGRNPADLITFINPEFVERDGMQLEEEGCLSVPGFNATVARPSRAVVKGLNRDGGEQVIEGDRAAGALLPARDGSPRGHAVRRSPPRPAERSDRQEDQEALAFRQMVIVFFGTPQFAVPTLRHLLDSPHTVAGVVTQPDRPRGRGQKVTDAPVKALATERGTFR